MNRLIANSCLFALIVLLGGAGPLPAQVSRLDLVELWRSDPSAEFTRIESLAVDSRGRVYIVEGRSRAAVSILRPDGALERRLGRAGDGPGEFREPLGVQVLPGDTLVVYDRRHYRLNVFAPGDDSPVRTLRLEGSADGAPFAAQFMPDGRLLVQLRRYYQAGANPADDVGRSQVFVLADPQTGELLGAPILRIPESEAGLIARRGAVVGETPIDFGDSHALRAAPDGTLVYGADDALRFERYDMDGNRIGGFEAAYPPVPFTRRDLEQEVNESSDFFRAALHEAAPEHWPSYADFQIDDRGRIFVTMSSSTGGSRDVRIFEPGGREVGRFSLPPHTRVQRVIGDRLYAVVKDEYDVPRVVKYSLDPAG